MIIPTYSGLLKDHDWAEKINIRENLGTNYKFIFSISKPRLYLYIPIKHNIILYFDVLEFKKMVKHIYLSIRLNLSGDNQFSWSP